MPEKLEFQSEINKSVRFREAKTERLTSDAGIVLMAELLAETGLIDHLAAKRTDCRNQTRVRLPFKFPLLLRFVQWMAGWMRLRDTVHLHKDPVFLVAACLRIPARGAGDCAGEDVGIPALALPTVGSIECIFRSKSAG